MGQDAAVVKPAYTMDVKSHNRAIPDSRNTVLISVSLPKLEDSSGLVAEVIDGSKFFLEAPPCYSLTVALPLKADTASCKVRYSNKRRVLTAWLYEEGPPPGHVLRKVDKIESDIPPQQPAAANKAGREGAGAPPSSASCSAAGGVGAAKPPGLPVEARDLALLRRLDPQLEMEVYGRTLRLSQKFRESVGGVVWDAAIVMSRFLEMWAASPGAAGPWESGKGVPVAGRRVLELGAGTGLAGIVASLLGAREVVLTDREEILPHAVENVRLNLPERLVGEAGAGEGEGEPVVRVCELAWGAGGAAGLSGHFDVVLLADVVYNKEGHEPLIETMREVCGPETTVLLAHKWRNKMDANFFFLVDAYFESEQLVEKFGAWAWSGWPEEHEGVQLHRLRLRR